MGQSSTELKTALLVVPLRTLYQPGQPSQRLRNEVKRKEQGLGSETEKVFQHTAVSLSLFSVAVTKYHSVAGLPLDHQPQNNDTEISY